MSQNNQNLPEINTHENLGEEDGVMESYFLEDNNEYKEFLYVVKDFIESDCHAVVLDGEVVYNAYKEMTYRENILENIVRDQIATNVHRLLISPAVRKNKDFDIEIYMFKTNSFKLVVHYDSDQKQFRLSKKGM